MYHSCCFAGQDSIAETIDEAAIMAVKNGTIFIYAKEVNDGTHVTKTELCSMDKGSRVSKQSPKIVPYIVQCASNQFHGCSEPPDTIKSVCCKPAVSSTEILWERVRHSYYYIWQVFDLATESGETAGFFEKY